MKEFSAIVLLLLCCGLCFVFGETEIESETEPACDEKQGKFFLIATISIQRIIWPVCTLQMRQHAQRTRCTDSAVQIVMPFVRHLIFGVMSTIWCAQADAFVLMDMHGFRPLEALAFQLTAISVKVLWSKSEINNDLFEMQNESHL